jgi:PLP dependent protein
MVGTSIAERLSNLRKRINDACRTAGREPSSVRLLAVSKLQDAAKIREAFACGQVDFGENYVQEALKKKGELADLPLRWHFIGRLQSNKLKQMARKFALIHSLERMETAILLNKWVGEKK